MTLLFFCGVLHLGESRGTIGKMIFMFRMECFESGKESNLLQR